MVCTLQTPCKHRANINYQAALRRPDDGYGFDYPRLQVQSHRFMSYVTTLDTRHETHSQCPYPDQVKGSHPYCNHDDILSCQRR